LGKRGGEKSTACLQQGEAILGPGILPRGLKKKREKRLLGRPKKEKNIRDLKAGNSPRTGR